MNHFAETSMFDVRSKLLHLAWVPFLVLFDQITKIFAAQQLKDEPPIAWMGDMIRIVYAENKGAFGSLGAGLSETQRFWLLTVANAVLLTGLVIYLLARRDVSRYQFVAFGLIFAGGIGNLLDRIMHGYVIDFMNVGIGWLRTNIFNVADMYIMLGFAMLIPLMFQESSQSSHASGDGKHSGALSATTELSGSGRN